MDHEGRQSCVAPIKSTTVPRTYNIVNLGSANQFSVVTFNIRFLTYVTHNELKILIEPAQNLKTSVETIEHEIMEIYM